MRKLSAALAVMSLAGWTHAVGGEALRLPERTFTFGNDTPRAMPNETPEQKVTVSSFSIDRTEVTVGAYRACVERGACPPPTIVSTLCTFTAGDDERPMNCVSWDEAATYCAARGDRLPTEAEWELAARGTEEHLYPWGDRQPTCEAAVSRRGEHTAEGCADLPLPVSPTRGCSRLGVADLAGNVEEWVADFYDDRHVRAEGRDPKGAPIGTAHVVRGGSFLSPWSHLRVTHRSWASVMTRTPGVGFRCAR